MKRNDFKILIAEDEAGIQRLYEKTFRAEGFEVVIAESGGQIMAELVEGSFDLLITDMKLNGMSALEALPFVRKLNPTIPIVVVSGHYVNMQEDFHQKGLNVDFVFNKPLKLETLKRAVRKILGLPVVENSKNDPVS